MRIGRGHLFLIPVALHYGMDMPPLESPEPQQSYDIIYNGFYKSDVIWWSLSRWILCLFVCCADVKRIIRAHPFPGRGLMSSLWLNVTFVRF
jgi:hypothetical protein